MSFGVVNIANFDTSQQGITTVPTFVVYSGGIATKFTGQNQAREFIQFGLEQLVKKINLRLKSIEFYEIQGQQILQ